MARSTVCLKCGATTTNGSRCPRCSGGTRHKPKGNAHRDPRYVRARDRLVAEHVARHGPVCPLCGGRVDKADHSTWLTADHITPLSMGGDILGPMRVLCLGCNVRALHAMRPEIARRGRPARSR